MLIKVTCPSRLNAARGMKACIATIQAIIIGEASFFRAGHRCSFCFSPGLEPEKSHRAEKMDVGCVFLREKVAKGRPTSSSGAGTAMLGKFLAVILVQRIDAL